MDVTHPDSSATDGSFRLRDWLVQPTLNRIERPSSSVHIEPKHMDLLVYLANNAGEIRSKEQILEAVWTQQYVAESALTRAVAELRRALDDDARSPRYIETIPKRGYRLIAQMEAPATKVEKASKPSWWWSIAGVSLVAALFLLYGRESPEAELPLTEGERILLTDFTNSTGDSVFDETLEQALAVKLEESPYLNLMSERRVRETLRLMERSPDETVTASLGREVCARSGVKAIMTGSIGQLGSNYVITIGAENCHTGKMLAREQIEVSAQEGVLGAVGRAAITIRQKLGESLASIERYDVPIEEATTSSLEALNALALGEKTRTQATEEEAIPFFKRALEIDPDFALAHARLGNAYANLGERDAAAEHKRRAFELSDRVSERERLYIVAQHHTTVTGDFHKEIEAYQLLKQAYPKWAVSSNNLCVVYFCQGLRQEHALQHAISQRLSGA